MAEETKFTPGPWSVGPVDDTVVTAIVNGERVEVAAIDGDYNAPDTWPIMEANARLIAAAPDMFEALNDCKWLFEQDELKPLLSGRWGDPAVIATKVSDALAKATGAA